MAERPAVVALVSGTTMTSMRELAAGFEEEAVPLVVETGVGTSQELAGRAAALSALGHGIGADRTGLVLALAVRPELPYLTAPLAEARPFGHAAARLVARRPVRLPAEAN